MGRQIHEYSFKDFIFFLFCSLQCQTISCFSEDLSTLFRSFCHFLFYSSLFKFYPLVLPLITSVYSHTEEILFVFKHFTNQKNARQSPSFQKIHLSTFLKNILHFFYIPFFVFILFGH